MEYSWVSMRTVRQVSLASKFESILFTKLFSIYIVVIINKHKLTLNSSDLAASLLALSWESSSSSEDRLIMSEAASGEASGLKSGIIMMSTYTSGLTPPNLTLLISTLIFWVRRLKEGLLIMTLPRLTCRILKGLSFSFSLSIYNQHYKDHTTTTIVDRLYHYYLPKC